jgi:hypothetical protein
VDRHRLDAEYDPDPDSTYHLDGDADPDPYPNPSFTHLLEIRNLVFTLTNSSASLQCFIFLASVIG